MAAGQRGGDPKGLYETLGVAADADVADIRKAYRRLALRWHPDKNPDNPEATGEFQKISSAYEVLSDPERRAMYDSTGCVDAEELNESGDLDHAADLFAAFFGGGGPMDMDPEEQAMMDEFLRMVGGGAFRRKGKGARARRNRTGRGGGGGARSSNSRAAAQEDQMMNELLMAAMAADLGGGFPPQPSPALACPGGHTLKKRKADATYACDLCGATIPENKRFLDCRKCDFSVCQKCQKQSEQEAVSQEQQEERQELLEAFCEVNVSPVRQGGRLLFRCKLCQALLDSQDAAAEHMDSAHGEQVQAFLEAVAVESQVGMGRGMGMGPSDPFGAGGLEELFMAASLNDLLGGGPLLSGGPPGGPSGRRSRKKR